MDETARALTCAGIQRGDRVAVVMPNGAEMASLFLGVASVSTCAPLNPAYRKSEFEFYLSDLEPKLVIVDAALDSPVRDVATAMGIEIGELHCREAGEAGSFDLHVDASGGTSSEAANDANASDVALVLHTSGTTSRPKIVPLTHENLCVSARNIAESLSLTEHDRCLNIMPLFHVHGLVGAVLSSLSVGASVVCTPGYKVTEFFQWLAEFKPTWYTGVPTMHHGILTRAEANRAVIAANPLRFVRSCSSALAPQIMEQLEETFGVPVLEAYGMTEAAHQMCSNGFPPRQRKPGSVGRPTGVDVAIMDDAGSLLAPGAEGEVVIRGSNVTSGYQNNPEANLKSFTAGWFRTGDQGRFDSDGDLFLTGRIKELIVRGGEKIAPREIDEALLAHSSVEQAMGFAVPDEALGEKVAAAVVLRAGTSATELELCEHAASLLADFKVPEKIVFVSELPKGPTGKPQRIGLAEKLGLTTAPSTEPAPKIEHCPPRNDIERQLAEMWCEVLKLERAGVRDNFFEAGGDSILASQLMARIRQTMGVDLTAPRLFQLPTIERLAEFVSQHANGSAVSSILPSVSRMDGIALTAAQQRMWFVWKLDPVNPVNNRSFAYRLKGSLDLFRLQTSFNGLVERHEILRTNYYEGDGEPMGVVRAAHAAAESVVDFSGKSDAEREAATLTWLRDESARPFNLETDPVLRYTVARIARDEYVLLLVVHHIACDASTEPTIVADLASAYNGTLSGATCAQFADYAAWQRPREAAAMEEGLAWWKQQLAGMEGSARIPTDMVRREGNRDAGSSVSFQLDVAALNRCKTLARKADTTVFTVLLASFYAMIYRFTGVEDLVVGTPVVVSNHAAAESIPGLFINILVLRTFAGGNPSFLDFLSRVRDTVHSAMARQEVPFDAVLAGLRPGGHHARVWPFQTAFEYRNTGKPRLGLDGIGAQRVEFDRGFTPFDLMLDMEPGGGGLQCRLFYHTDQFEHATVERLARHYQVLLNRATNSPHEPLAQLPLLTPEEKTEILALGEQTSSFPGECLHLLFEQQVERSPDKIAVVFEKQSLTYRELNERANQLAHFLRCIGVGPESLVGLYIERSLDMLVAVIGILKAGGAYLPVDTVYPKDRVRFMLEDGQVRVLLTQQSLLESLPQTEARVVCLDTELGSIAAESRENPECNVGPDNLAYVIYTSGSTGNPKGCMVTHANVSRLMRATDPWYQFHETDVWTMFHSHAFDVSVWEMWGALLYGGRLVVVSYLVSRSPDQFHQLLHDERVTVLSQTPSAFRQFMLADEGVPASNLALRLVIFGGEALELASLRPWFDKHGDRRPQLVNMYGITETTVHSTYRPLTAKDAQEDRGSAIGIPIPDLSLHILDKNLQPRPIGACGEIYVGGAGVARGYLNRPELTHARFIDNPFSKRAGDRLYRSGDLARRLNDHDIEFLGRADNQVKLRGFRIELGEIEAELRQHAGVRDAVIALIEREGDKHLVGYVVPATSMPDAENLRAFLGQRLPDYMIPSMFVALDAVPLNANGKLDRRALPEPAIENIVQSKEFFAPRTQLEKELTEIWQETLGLGRIGIKENFFDIGGHSLAAMRMVVRIRRAFGVELPVAAIFQSPTIEALAVEVETLRASTHNEEDLLRILAEIEAMPATKTDGHGTP